MISRDTYLRYRGMTRAYKAARKKFDPRRYQRGGGYTPKDRVVISAIAGTRDTTNDEKAQVEEFEWRMFPPSKYFAYYDKGLTKITNWTGITLGRIIQRGQVYRDTFGGKRCNITVVGTNNAMYTGVCNMSSGTYCRLKRIKGRNRHVLRNRPKKSRLNPRAKDLGAYVRVTMTADDVARFKSRWPASGLPNRAIWFEFQKSNGDLVDISPGSERYDGSALAALSQDAQKFAGL